VAPGEDGVAALLVQTATERLTKDAVRSVRCWLPRHHPYRHALLANGIVPGERRVALLYVPLRLDPGRLSLFEDPAARIHFMAGDADVV